MNSLTCELTEAYNKIERLETKLNESQNEIDELHRQLGAIVAEEIKTFATTLAVQELQNTIDDNTNLRVTLKEVIDEYYDDYGLLVGQNRNEYLPFDELVCISKANNILNEKIK